MLKSVKIEQELLDVLAELRNPKRPTYSQVIRWLLEERLRHSTALIEAPEHLRFLADRVGELAARFEPPASEQRGTFKIE